MRLSNGVYFMSCFQELLLGNSNSSIVVRCALNSHKSMAHSFPAARLIAAPYIFKWTHKDCLALWQREPKSLFLLLIHALLLSHLPVSVFLCCTPSSHYSFKSNLISMYCKHPLLYKLKIEIIYLLYSCRCIEIITILIQHNANKIPFLPVSQLSDWHHS